MLKITKKELSKIPERKVFMQHPERKPDELFLGNLELDNREKEDFNWVKAKTELKTIRVGKISYNEDGINAMHEFKGICDTYGPYPLFIKESEFDEIKQRNKNLTPQILFKRIIDRETEVEAEKRIEEDRSKEFVGIIYYVGDGPNYFSKAPDCPAGGSMDSIQLLSELIADKYGENFENKITFTPIKDTPSSKFHKLSIMEEKIFKMWVLKTLEGKKTT